MPGLAAWRSYFAHARRRRSSPTTLGANRSIINPRPIWASASWSVRATSSGDAPMAKSGATVNRAKQSTRIRLDTRSGWASVNVVARMPPPRFAMTTAFSEPTASRTADASSIHSSMVGRADVAIGSDSPEPRLSYMMSRPNDARRSRNSASGRKSHCASMWLNHWSRSRMSGGPSAEDLMGEMDIANPGVVRLREHRARRRTATGRRARLRPATRVGPGRARDPRRCGPPATAASVATAAGRGPREVAAERRVLDSR